MTFKDCNVTVREEMMYYSSVYWPPYNSICRPLEASSLSGYHPYMYSSAHCSTSEHQDLTQEKENNPPN